MRKFNLIILPVLLIIASAAAFILNKPDQEKNEKVITALGDSLTYGLGDSEGQGYVTALQQKLNEKHPEEKYNVKSYGVVGQESEGLLHRIGNLKIAREVRHSDYIIVFIGTNDLVNSSTGNDLKGLPPEKLAEAKQEYLKNLNKIVGTIHTLNEDVPIILLGLYNPYPNTGGKIEPYIDEWNQSAQRLVRDKKFITFIPTNDLFKGKMKKDYFHDSLHVNEKGYNLIAEKILNSYRF